VTDAAFAAKQKSNVPLLAVSHKRKQGLSKKYAKNQVLFERKCVGLRLHTFCFFQVMLF